MHAHPIYLVRHGQTEWNAQDRLQGCLDSPLTERGQTQARAIGQALAPILAGHGDWALWASPQGRVQATLALASQSGAWRRDHIRIDARLAELTYGDWDGMSRAEIEARHPGLQAHRLRRHWSFVPPNGESYASLAARVAPVLAEALDAAASHAVLIFSHGAVGRALRGLYGKLPSHETVRLDEPQDAFHRLLGGKIETVGV